ncbi:MAG: ATP-binding cassette domain-containing protein, partial [Steroidobacteraceae bacterium]
MNDNVVLACDGLVKEFRQGPATVRVLRGVSASIRRGERLAVVGASGSGKTTLLQLLGGLDLPTAGRVMIDGREMSALPDVERGRLRNVAMGFVYQFHHLLPEFSALENVAMPLLIRRLPRAQAEESARTLLARVGLADRLAHRPAEL